MDVYISPELAGLRIDSESKPAICLSCKRNDIEDWDDDSRCCPYRNLLQESQDPVCFAYEPLW